MGPRSYVRQLKFFLIKNILTKYTVETTASYFVRRFLIKRISIVASRFLRAAQRAHTRARARAATCAKPSEKPSEEPSWRGLPLSLPLRPALSLPTGEQLCKKILHKKIFKCRLTLLACSAARPHARARARAQLWEWSRGLSRGSPSQTLATV